MTAPDQQPATGLEPGFAAYGELLKDELEAQEKRKASFEQRGLAVITTSGTLVTLLFALAALSTKENDTFVLPANARTWLSAGLTLFVLAAILAVLTNVPLRYQAVTADGVKKRLNESPVRDATEAAKDIALTRVKVLRDAKRKNGLKGLVLVCAMILEVAATFCVARAIAIIL